MGACYSVNLKVKFTDAEGAKDALQRKVARAQEDHTNYNLDHYRGDLGLDLDSLKGLLQVFFGGWEARLRPAVGKDGIYLTSDFDASYGWEGVMMEAFEDLAPYMEEGSSIKIYPDSDYDHAVVKEGKAVWIH